MNLKIRVAQIQHAANIVGLVNSAYRGETSRKGWTTEADHMNSGNEDPL